jgi:hypothetical protein
MVRHPTEEMYSIGDSELESQRSELARSCPSACQHKLHTFIEQGKRSDRLVEMLFWIKPTNKANGWKVGKTKNAHLSTSRRNSREASEVCSARHHFDRGADAGSQQYFSSNGGGRGEQLCIVEDFREVRPRYGGDPGAY